MVRCLVIRSCFEVHRGQPFLFARVAVAKGDLLGVVVGVVAVLGHPQQSGRLDVVGLGPFHLLRFIHISWCGLVTAQPVALVLRPGLVEGAGPEGGVETELVVSLGRVEVVVLDGRLA